MQDPKKIRNIAIIAHVDHGKTTLVDHLIKQAGTFRENQAVEERLMDSMDLEKERGITIAAKNASFTYNDIKINIVDTPGHSDFGGEVERVLNMVDGAILLCDASEGPLPQTRFVLKKALEQNIKVIVVINKIDRSDARIQDVHNELFDLFIDVEANEEQCDFHTIYAIARDGMATLDPKVNTGNLKVLYDAIVELVPPPTIKENEPLQMMVSNIGYNDYVGRLAMGRMRAGSVKIGDDIVCIGENDKTQKVKVSALFQYHVNSQIPVTEIGAGDMAIIAGIEDFTIGDTITSALDPRPLPRIKVDEPTVGMVFSVNNGPFAGQEGKNVTSRKILERLERELLYNVSIRVEKTDATDAFKVVGRGELQLGVLIEQMRREGFELLVSKPSVVIKHEGGRKLEPFEHAVIDIEDAYVGPVTEKMGQRKGVMTNMVQKGTGRTRLEFRIPARGLIGYRSEFLTDTRGTGLLNTNFDGWDDYRGDINSRINGAMVSDRQGEANAYSIWNKQERGTMFVNHGDQVYEGMIVGEHAKDNDLIVNIIEAKRMSNVRASGSDEAIRVIPVRPMTLEKAMEWIKDSELIEVTPKTIRMRLKELDPHKRPKVHKDKDK